jgi:hypothetical protein
MHAGQAGDNENDGGDPARRRQRAALAADGGIGHGKERGKATKDRELTAKLVEDSERPEKRRWWRSTGNGDGGRG